MISSEEPSMTARTSCSSRAAPPGPPPPPPPPGIAVPAGVAEKRNRRLSHTSTSTSMQSRSADQSISGGSSRSGGSGGGGKKYSYDVGKMYQSLGILPNDSLLLTLDSFGQTKGSCDAGKKKGVTAKERFRAMFLAMAKEHAEKLRKELFRLDLCLHHLNTMEEEDAASEWKEFLAKHKQIVELEEEQEEVGRKVDGGAARWDNKAAENHCDVDVATATTSCAIPLMLPPVKSSAASAASLCKERDEHGADEEGHRANPRDQNCEETASRSRTLSSSLHDFDSYPAIGGRGEGLGSSPKHPSAAIVGGPLDIMCGPEEDGRDASNTQPDHHEAVGEAAMNGGAKANGEQKQEQGQATSRLHPQGAKVAELQLDHLLGQEKRGAPLTDAEQTREVIERLSQTLEQHLHARGNSGTLLDSSARSSLRSSPGRAVHPTKSPCSTQSDLLRRMSTSSAEDEKNTSFPPGRTTGHPKLKSCLKKVTSQQLPAASFLASPQHHGNDQDQRAEGVEIVVLSDHGQGEGEPRHNKSAHAFHNHMPIIAETGESEQSDSQPQPVRASEHQGRSSLGSSSGRPSFANKATTHLKITTSSTSSFAASSTAGAGSTSRAADDPPGATSSAAEKTATEARETTTPSASPSTTTTRGPTTLGLGNKLLLLDGIGGARKQRNAAAAAAGGGQSEKNLSGSGKAAAAADHGRNSKDHSATSISIGSKRGNKTTNANQDGSSSGAAGGELRSGKKNNKTSRTSGSRNPLSNFHALHQANSLGSNFESYHPLYHGLTVATSSHQGAAAAAAASDLYQAAPSSAQAAIAAQAHQAAMAAAVAAATATGANAATTTAGAYDHYSAAEHYQYQQQVMAAQYHMQMMAAASMGVAPMPAVPMPGVGVGAMMASMQQGCVGGGGGVGGCATATGSSAASTNLLASTSSVGGSQHQAAAPPGMQLLPPLPATQYPGTGGTSCATTSSTGGKSTILTTSAGAPGGNGLKPNNRDSRSGKGGGGSTTTTSEKKKKVARVGVAPLAKLRVGQNLQTGLPRAWTAQHDLVATTTSANNDTTSLGNNKIRTLSLVDELNFADSPAPLAAAAARKSTQSSIVAAAAQKQMNAATATTGAGAISSQDHLRADEVVITEVGSGRNKTGSEHLPQERHARTISLADELQFSTPKRSVPSSSGGFGGSPTENLLGKDAGDSCEREQGIDEKLECRGEPYTGQALEKKMGLRQTQEEQQNRQIFKEEL